MEVLEASAEIQGHQQMAVWESETNTKQSTDNILYQFYNALNIISLFFFLFLSFVYFGNVCFLKAKKYSKQKCGLAKSSERKKTHL